MFAPRPDDVAKEMVRVTKAGGTIVMGNWIPGDPTLVAQILKTCAAYSPAPPEGFVSPMLWGQEEKVAERFVAAGIDRAQISFQKDIFRFDFAGTAAEAVDRFRHYYGPTMNAFEAAAKDGREEELQQELVALFDRQNEGGEGHTQIPAAFLRVTAKKG